MNNTIRHSLSLCRIFSRTVRPATLGVLLATAHCTAGLTALLIAGPSFAHAQQSGTDDLGGTITQVLPASALDISEALKVAKVGQSITIRGYVPATPTAFPADGSSFTLAEPVRTIATPTSKSDGPVKV